MKSNSETKEQKSSGTERPDGIPVEILKADVNTSTQMLY